LALDHFHCFQVSDGVSFVLLTHCSLGTDGGDGITTSNGADTMNGGAGRDY
jgi:hypothetical protein